MKDALHILSVAPSILLGYFCWQEVDIIGGIIVGLMCFAFLNIVINEMVTE